jgi:hypothetical protein
MSDQEIFSDPEAEHQNKPKQPDDRQARVREAFGSLHQTLGTRVSDQDEQRVLGIREAVESGDRARAEEHLSKVREESSWLYEELMKHPEISAIMRELSIMGL